MTCDHGRETVVRTGEAPSLGRQADRIALTGEVGGSPVGTDALTGVVTALEGTATPVEMTEESHSSWTALPDFLWPSAPRVKLFAQRSVNWAAPPTSERSSPGRGILISAHLSRATRGTIGRL